MEANGKQQIACETYDNEWAKGHTVVCTSR